MADLYHWRAVYSDGSSLAEYDELAPSGHGFAEVEQERLAYLLLEPQQAGLTPYCFQAPAGVPLRFLRRRRQWLQGELASGWLTLHIVGWPGHYTAISPDGAWVSATHEGDF